MKSKIKINHSQKFSLKQIFEYRLIKVGLVLAILAGVSSLVMITHSSVSDTFAFDQEPWGYNNSCKVSESSSYTNQLNFSEADGSTVCILGNDQGNIPGSWNRNDYKTIAFMLGYNFETPQDASSLFWKYQNLESFAVTPSLITFDTSNTTNMAHMFRELKNIKSGEVEKLLAMFNTSNVTDMQYMFADDESIETLNLDYSGFNTTNVTNMHGMFVGMPNLTTLTLGSNFKTSNVADMTGAFRTYAVYNPSTGHYEASTNKLSTIIINTDLNLTADAGLRGIWCAGSSYCYVGDTGNAGQLKLIGGSTTTYKKMIELDPTFTVTSSHTYNGDVQTVTISGYDPATMDITGNTGVNADTYTAYITPKSDYAWDFDKKNDSKGAVAVQWTIAKSTAPTPTCVPTGLTGTTGNTLSTISLSSCPGLSWANGSQTISSGSKPYSAIYNPNPVNYENRTGVQVTVTGVDPTPGYTEISKPSTNPSAINYDNSEHTAPGYNSTTMNYSGTLKATIAGSYTVSVTPKSGYKWTGGTDEAVTINWSISRVEAPMPSSSSIPTGLTGIRGEAISTVSLASYPGFSWVRGGDEIQLGPNSYDANYNPDVRNYTNRIVQITVTGTERITGVKIPIDKPATNQTIAYDGREGEYAPAGYNEATMTVTAGTPKATGRGNYTVTVKPKSAYVWADDGTTSEVTISWHVVKGTPTRPSGLKDEYEGVIGQPLSSITLPSICDWEEDDETTKITSGTNAHYVNCNPDPTNYNNLRVQVNVKGVESEDPGNDDPSGSGDSKDSGKKGPNAPNTGAEGSESSFAKVIGSALAIIAPLGAAAVVIAKKHHKRVDFNR